MNATTTRVEDVPSISRSEAKVLAPTENERMIELMGSLGADDWTKPTDCEQWDVRAMSGHVIGMMQAFTSAREFMRQMRAGKKAAGDGPFIDGLTSVQVREHAPLSTEQLVDRAVDIAPRAARWRGRVPALFRQMPMKEEVNGESETWKLGYLLDVILTRDVWMHRVDITRATGRELVITPEHDGRIVADVVAEWARRHGKAFTLVLEGPAGGTFTNQGGGEEITLDAVEFCRIVSGRATGTGLLTTEVPF